MMQKFFNNYPRKYFLWYVGGFLGLFGTNYLSTVIPRKVEVAIDLLPYYNRQTELHSVLCMIVILGVLLLLTRTLSRVLIFFPGRFVEYDIRNELYQKLMTLDVGFYRHRKVGDLMSCLINDVQNLRLMVGFAFLHILNTFLIFPFAIYQMFNIHFYLALIALSPFPFLLLVSRRYVSRFYYHVSKSQSLLGELTDQIVEIVSAIFVIKAFGREKAFLEVFEKKNQTYRDNFLRLSLIRSKIFPLLAMTGSIGLLLVFYFGGRFVIEGKISLGQLVAFNSYIALLVWPSAALGWIMNIFQRGKASWKRIDEILCFQPAEDQSREFLSENINEPSLEVRDLTFYYPGQEKPALKNIQLHIPFGEKVGIFGPTGCGKSTLIRILARQEKLESKQIFINNGDLSFIDPEKYRKIVSVVFQDPYLFSDTIKENLTYYKYDSKTSGPRLNEILEDSCLWEDISLFEDRLETLIGEKGVLLSGGQKKRLALARSLYKEHEILMLDDVFSAIDQALEDRLIRTIFKKQHKKQTLVVVSHRIRVFEHCDRVLIMKEGQIVDEGSHQELLNKEGIYRDTWLYQKNEGEN